MTEPNDELRRKTPLSPARLQLTDALHGLIQSEGRDSGIRIALHAICFFSTRHMRIPTHELAAVGEELKAWLDERLRNFSRRN